MSSNMNPELTIEHVTSTSTNNVEGYLRNISARRKHATAGEGGRGTKVNRNGAVTASEHFMLKNGPVEVKPTVEDEEGDEWDDVNMDEKLETKPGVDDDAPPVSFGVTSETNAPTSLWELREAAKAQRWTEKNHLFAQCVTSTLLHLGTLRNQYRQAVDPRLPHVSTTPLARSTDDRSKENDLSPSWVSAKKNGSGTAAGDAAQAIVSRINEVVRFVESGLADEPPLSALLDAYRCGRPVCVSSFAGFAMLFIHVAVYVGRLQCRLCKAFSAYEDVSHRGDSADAATAFRPARVAAPKSAKMTDARKAKPVSSIWAEVWCPTKQIWVSVNTCGQATTRWGAPYVLAYGGDHAADVTARYTSSWSSIYKWRIDEMHYTKGYLWKEELEDQGVEDGEGEEGAVLSAYACSSAPQLQSSRRKPVSTLSPLERLLWPLCQDVSAATAVALGREEKQLTALMYSEPVPTKVTDLKGHPLFVTEEALTRYEGIYPKTGSSIVGYIRGKPVFRRDCVHPLRSRQGWLRLGRAVPPDVDPYRLVPPPPSRPLVAPSQLYGKWQTGPFEPAALESSGTIPRFEGTSWYVLLGAAAPGAGLTHLSMPNVAAVARRMRCEFAVCVTGWKRQVAGGSAEPAGRAPQGDVKIERLSTYADAEARQRQRGQFFAQSKWAAQFHGIVVPSAIAERVEHAYTEYMQLKASAEAAKRRLRAMRWWRLLIQLGLAKLRVASSYAGRGKRAVHRASAADI